MCNGYVSQSLDGARSKERFCNAAPSRRFRAGYRGRSAPPCKRASTLPAPVAVIELAPVAKEALCAQRPLLAPDAREQEAVAPPPPPPAPATPAREASVVEEGAQDLPSPKIDAALEGLQLFLERAGAEQKRPSTACRRCRCFLREVPKNFSITEYFKRLSTYMKNSSECYVVAAVYMARLTKQHPHIEFSQYSVYMIFLSCVLLATKYLEDDCKVTAYYSKVGFVTVQELLIMEDRLAKLLGWRLYVGPEDFERCLEALSQGALPEL
eukprot:TRINITY_DN14187_c0_g2_i1.p1 TRINITY_DN14187_c0_g2~~TRINITY_DN14187_c0_g2_i1.p1  ORF type:complete len:290 (-),score=66.13 TRINITY_DN14187_c0_g2_i1:99-902(-)